MYTECKFMDPVTDVCEHDIKHPGSIMAGKFLARSGPINFSSFPYSMELISENVSCAVSNWGYRNLQDF